jgi:hypothetical protein
MSLSWIRTIVGAALLGVGLLTNLPARADELAAIDPQARTGAAGWRVDGITGEATAQRGAEAATPLAVGQVLSPGSEIATGAGAVVFLSHNGDRLIVQPKSRMRIDAPGTEGLLDHFMQSLGSVFYDVEPRKNRSFGVSAPYVAAIVKGTRFLVTVAPDKNSVRVDRGRVLVESKDGAPPVLVDGGMVATAVPALARGVTLSSSGIPDTTATPAAESLGMTETGGTVATAGGSATGAAGDAVSSTVDKVTDTVGGVVGGVSKAVGNVASGTANTVGGAVSAVGDAVGDTVGAVGSTAGNAVSAVGNAVSGTTSAAGNLVGGAVSGVSNAVGGVTNAVGGAVGGLLGGKS